MVHIVCESCSAGVVRGGRCGAVPRLPDHRVYWKPVCLRRSRARTAWLEVQTAAGYLGTDFNYLLAFDYCLMLFCGSLVFWWGGKLAGLVLKLQLRLQLPPYWAVAALWEGRTL